MNNSSIAVPVHLFPAPYIDGIHIACGVFAILGNAFILFIIARTPKIRENFCNLLIGLLAFADFYSGIGLLVNSGLSVYSHWTQLYFTRGQCLLTEYISLSGFQMSQMATVFISLDRLKAIRDPVHYLSQNRIQRFSFTCSLTLTYSLVSGACMFIGIDFNSDIRLCQTAGVVHPYYFLYWYIYALVVAVCVFICYLLTARTMAKKQSKATNSRSSLARDLKLQKAVFQTVRIVLVIYGICWCLPNFFTAMCYYLSLFSPAVNVRLGPIVGLGSALNCCLNILVYAWKHKELGAEMRSALWKKQPVTPIVPIVSGSSNTRQSKPIGN